MRDFPILPILLILYVIAVSGGRKKKATKQRQRPARAASRAQKREDARARTEQTAQGFSTAFARAQSQPVPEGEDPCHPAPKREQTAEQAHETEQETEPDALAQDVLRGVVMSEILTRPCERRARKRYHG